MSRSAARMRLLIGSFSDSLRIFMSKKKAIALGLAGQDGEVLGGERAGFTSLR